MRVAVVGSGIAGLTVAHRLAPDHDVVVLEAADRPGGHAHTHDVELGGRTFAVDTGFIVCNDRNYPHFTALMGELGISLQDSDMGFSVRADFEDFEYSGDSFSGLFAVRRHLRDPRFLRMIVEYARFNRVGRRFLASGDETTSLRAFLEREGFSDWFVQRLLVPQASAVWSADPEQMWTFPAAFLLRFFHNHGILGFTGRPNWQTVPGGSRTYVEAITRPLGERLRLSSPVRAVARDEDGATVTVEGHEPERFDEVVLACHSDQALALLADASPEERDVLGAIPYHESEAVLHTDRGLLPRRERAWASWNCHLLAEADRVDGPALTYHMNRLQSLDAPEELCVTLNRRAAIDPERIISVQRYAHPIFTPEGLVAQRRWADVSGVRHTHFCGAWWRWGFHEDGVWSGLRVAAAIRGTELDPADARPPALVGAA